jgi:hypothetical protein
MRALALAALIVVVAGCGSSSSAPVIGAARTFALARFSVPAARAGAPATLSFVIRQPSGRPLTRFRTGSGPHTGVHLIVVRSDLGAIIHRHPPIGAGGKISERLTFPTGGRYLVLVDAYPALSGPLRNFQLKRWVTVAGPRVSKPLPPPQSRVSVDGFSFTMLRHAPLHAIQAAFLHFTVTDPQGRPARFTSWYGALAHAIFFRAGSLDYFHTHVCGPGATGCTSVFGGARVTGTSAKPGRLDVGVLVPVGGTWRLFLQTRANGHIVTAPFTLVVRS